MEFPVENWCRILPTEFQTLVESMPRCIEAFMAHDGPTLMLVFPLFWQLSVYALKEWAEWTDSKLKAANMAIY